MDMVFIGPGKSIKPCVNIIINEKNILNRYISRQDTVELKKDPFLDDFSYFLYGNPDIEKMNRAAELLFDYTDFTSFSKLHTDVQTNDCKIIQAGWKKENHRLIFTIKANRFLRGMVRTIVGTTLELGFDKICLAEFRKIIEDKDSSKAGFSVPARGLILVDIEYPEGLILP
ncbi:tRNA pseudouridine synthase A [subsurface metagenome]